LPADVKEKITQSVTKVTLCLAAAAAAAEPPAAATTTISNAHTLPGVLE
jgi:hypothetical protein